jgi:hypothetical protein
LYERELEAHTDRYEVAISKLSAEKLSEIISESRFFNLDGASHTMLLVKRTNINDLERASVGPITTAVKLQLRNKIRPLGRDEQRRLYDLTASVKMSRQFAGVVFEAFAQTELQGRVTLKLGETDIR